MTRIEIFLGGPFDNLPDLGEKPDQVSAPRGDQESYPVFYYRPYGDNLMVRFEMLDGKLGLARVISATRGALTDNSEFEHDQIITVPAEAKPISEGLWLRRKSKKT